jgi:hypothetical protein
MHSFESIRGEYPAARRCVARCGDHFDLAVAPARRAAHVKSDLAGVVEAAESRRSNDSGRAVGGKVQRSRLAEVRFAWSSPQNLDRDVATTVEVSIPPCPRDNEPIANVVARLDNRHQLTIHGPIGGIRPVSPHDSEDLSGRIGSDRVPQRFGAERRHRFAYMYGTPPVAPLVGDDIVGKVGAV